MFFPCGLFDLLFFIICFTLTQISTVLKEPQYKITKESPSTLITFLIINLKKGGKPFVCFNSVLHWQLRHLKLKYCIFYILIPDSIKFLGHIILVKLCETGESELIN